MEETSKNNETAQLGIGAIRHICIDFAEWILKEEFEKYEDNGKCWWGRFKEDKDYSTEQLYEMWSSKYQLLNTNQMSQKTTLQDFCNFLEKEIKIDLTTEQWKKYRQEKEFALVNERNQMIDAYYAGTAQFDNAAPIVNPKEPKVYVNEKYGDFPF